MILAFGYKLLDIKLIIFSRWKTYRFLASSKFHRKAAVNVMYVQMYVNACGRMLLEDAIPVSQWDKKKTRIR
jgi:hypothetical protein